jgi:N-acetylmuramoyl-L-alanine amidase
MNIINSNLQFRTNQLAYENKPDTIVLHHAEASHCTVQEVHQWHLANGWAGIGYHYFINKEGNIYTGRPEGATGAHCPSMNNHSIGICVEGEYMKETMPEAQKRSVIELGVYIKKKYGIGKVGGHKEFYSTDCPGTNYPLTEVKNAILSGNATVINNVVASAPASSNVEKFEAYGTVTASVLNVRNEPSTNGSVLGTLAKDTKVHIGGKLNSWYNIFFGSNGGWVSGEYINLSSGSSASAPVKPVDSTKYGTVTANSGLNVRSGPGTGYKVIGSLSKGQKVRIGSNASGWYNIFYGEHGGWVSDQYLQV